MAMCSFLIPHHMESIILLLPQPSNSELMSYLYRFIYTFFCFSLLRNNSIPPIKGILSNFFVFLIHAELEC